MQCPVCSVDVRVDDHGIRRCSHPGCIWDSIDGPMTREEVDELLYGKDDPDPEDSSAG